jgi:hypothetical protein
MLYELLKPRLKPMAPALSMALVEMGIADPNYLALQAFNHALVATVQKLNSATTTTIISNNLVIIAKDVNATGLLEAHLETCQ